MEVLEFVFKDFWNFTGSLIILSIVLHFLHVGWLRFWRFWNIQKHGWPPEHIDADGDFKTKKDG